MAARVVKRGSGPSEMPMQFHSHHSHAAPSPRTQRLIYALTFACVVLLVAVLGLLTSRAPEPSALGLVPVDHQLAHLTDVANLSPAHQTGNIFVSYSYFEKDAVQVRHLLRYSVPPSSALCGAPNTRWNSAKRPCRS